MSNAIFQAKAAAFAAKNDALRRAFALDGVRCFLLKRNGQTEFFVELAELTSGFYVIFDNDRSESGLFRYAVADLSGFRDTWAEANAIAYGVPDGSSKLEVYKFAAPDTGKEKDAIDPDARSIYFSGRIVRVANARHTIA